MSLAAAISLAGIPMVQAASTSGTKPQPKNQSIQNNVGAKQAAFTRATEDEFKNANPALYARAMKAQAEGKPLIVSSSEAAFLKNLNKKSMTNVKAGAVQWLLVISTVVLVVLYVEEVRAADAKGLPRPSFGLFLCNTFRVWFPVLVCPQRGGITEIKKTGS